MLHPPGPKGQRRIRRGANPRLKCTGCCWGGSGAVRFFLGGEFSREERPGEAQTSTRKGRPRSQRRLVLHSHGSSSERLEGRSAEPSGLSGEGVRGGSIVIPWGDGRLQALAKPLAGVSRPVLAREQRRAAKTKKKATERARTIVLKTQSLLARAKAKMQSTQVQGNKAGRISGAVGRSLSRLRLNLEPIWGLVRSGVGGGT